MKIIINISLLALFILTATGVNAVSPPPDGGYANGNTAEGQDALLNLGVSGSQNTALGFEALLSETSGDNNTATGYQALHSNTTGSANTATGVWALTANTTGSANTAIGIWSLFSNTTGENNTATGLQALYSNTSGMFNTATGSAALFENTTGNSNSAMGSGALVDNTIGNNNSAMGVSALAVNTTGSNNTAQGYFALVANTTGSNNTANGVSALQSNTTGSNNIALGFSAGVNLSTGSSNIDIGNTGVAGESNKIRIGSKGTHKATSIAGISGVTVANGVGVIINTQGQLGTVVSSERFKDQIKPMDKASETILSLELIRSLEKIMIGVTSKHLIFDGVTFGRLPPLRFDRLENWLRQCQMFRSDPERPRPDKAGVAGQYAG